jgi:hypothetical protein
MTDGCEQRKRLPAALSEGYFQPVETSFETLVAMSADLGSRLRFVDDQQRAVGTWGELFDTDEALVMARIIATDLALAQARFMHDADSAPPAVLAEQVVELARQIDHWLKALSLSEEAGSRSLRARIEHLVTQMLGDDLKWIFDRFGKAAPMVALRERFDPLWLTDRPMRAVHGQRSEPEVLRGRFFSLLSAASQLQALARKLLPQSLVSQAHAPAASLLMAFLQLHEVAQRRINQFTRRHADFYYDEVLCMQPLPAVPDSVHLVLERDPRATRELLIARGTPFVAGKDANGQPIEFLADESLHVTDARVSALLTLCLNRDPLISPEREFGYATRAESACLPWPPRKAPATDAAPPYWPMFSGSSHLPGGSQQARIGLAFASPLLFLQEGEREISLKLTLGHPVKTDARTQALSSRVAAASGVTARRARRFLQLLVKQYLLLTPELSSPAERADINGTAVRLAGQVLARAPVTDGPLVGCYERYLVEWTASAPTHPLFFARLGKLFAYWLMSHDDWLSDLQLDALREAATRLLDACDRPAPTAGDPRCLIQGPNRPERALIFGQIFNSLFEFSLSTASGWLSVSDFYVTSGAETQSPTSPFTTIDVVLRLRSSDPAVVGCIETVHGTSWATTLPVLQLRLRSDGRLYPYSLLEEMLLNEAQLAVQVRGVRKLLLDNNLGRLDASKPFMPFGPLPTTASYLVFGSPEMARKNVTHLAVNLRWSGLPVDEGGFARYYAAYPSELPPTPPLRNASFTVTGSILRDGIWQAAGAPGSLQLFQTADRSGRLGPGARLVFNETALLAHAWGRGEVLEFKPGALGGFYRLQLASPGSGFGHAQYSGLLTEVVSANTLRKGKRPQPLPPAPYTPLVEDITLDYAAQSTLVFGRESAPLEAEAASKIERVLHLHPFGQVSIYPGAAEAHPTLWPRIAHDGNLYIGLSLPDEGDVELGSHLTLHFHLRDEAAVETFNGEPRPKTHWAYLASNQWRPLSASQVVSDTTCGFLTSGIVTLDLPSQIDRNNTLLPADCHWLRLSVDGGFETFAALYGVRTQALRATRVLPAGARGVMKTLPAGSVKEPGATLYGLASLAQIGPSFGMRAAEDRQQMRTRVGERLRHKQRASTPWDYERLVLEHFPSVLKVKCFPHLTSRVAGVSPGEVVVVVVPSPLSEAAAAEPHLNAVELARIQAYLKGLASPFARIQVRNAVYERIQVSCTVKLARGVQAGHALRRINQAITDHISPWRSGGYQPSFDWTIRCADVEAHIRTLDCVDFVTQLSLLHVARSDDRIYTLSDTARGQTDQASRARPRSPWSIALPMHEHMVRTVDTTTDDRPEPIGIAQLGVGSTFIIGGAAR